MFSSGNLICIGKGVSSDQKKKVLKLQIHRYLILCHFSVGRMYTETVPKANYVGKRDSLVLEYDLQHSNLLCQGFH